MTFPNKSGPTESGPNETDPNKESDTAKPAGERYDTFAAFWPHYLREHARPETRALHYIGTALVIAIAVVAVVTGNWWLLVAMPLAGYFFAWLAHFTVEKNRPATFTYPLWSLGADFKMFGMWATGRLRPELERAGVS